jgi:DNA-binding GntR family transcriptional regulator
VPSDSDSHATVASTPPPPQRAPLPPQPAQELSYFTKAEAAYVRLRAEVTGGMLSPGSALDQEGVAKRLGVSTTPLREAIRRLEGEGLLRVTAHKEVIVAPTSMSELRELYETRLALDPLAVKLAAERATDDERAYLRTMLTRSDDNSPTARLQENRLIHRTMYRACHNDILIDVLEGLWDRSDRYRYVIIDNADEDVDTAVAAEHASLIEAVVEGRGEDAEVLMREHLMSSVSSLSARFTNESGHSMSEAHT